MAEIGEGDDGALADAQHLLQHLARVAGGLERLGQDDVIETVVGIIGEIDVGVALDHRKALGDAIVDAFLRNLDAARVHVLGLGEEPQQFAVAAADIEHPRAALDHAGDEQEIDARRSSAVAVDRAAALSRLVLRPAPAAMPRALRGAAQEAAHGGDQIRLVEQEGVVALVGLDLDEGDRRAAGVQRMDDGARSRRSDRASRR